MEEMKDLMSREVGQLFWQGASAHLRQRLASKRAPRSVRVVCLISEKSLLRSQPAWQSFRFQCSLFFLVSEVGRKVAKCDTTGFNAKISKSGTALILSP